LVRPLLGFTREEIHEYAVSSGLSWREDRTNADSTFKRNRVRNEIFPLFARINPSYLDALDRDMRHLRQVQAIADDFADARRDNLLVQDGESGARIDIRRLLAEKHWEYALYRLLEPYSFSLSDLGDLCRLLREGETRSGKTFRSKDGLLITTARELIVSRPAESAPESDELIVEGPGDYSLLGVSFRVSVEAGKPGSALKQPTGTLIFDGGKLPFPFTVRKWREGDWIRPLGLRAASGRPGRKKLSDLFVDLKLGLPEKEKALVVAGEGSHVHALLGLRIDESVKVSESTVSLTRIRITGCR
jgi:tRNA(Ile)-lysidine synthase